jgi:hypothetical protein
MQGGAGEFVRSRADMEDGLPGFPCAGEAAERRGQAALGGSCTRKANWSPDRSQLAPTGPRTDR